MAAAGDSTTTPLNRAGHLLANSSFSPRLVSLNVEVNRTLEPALGKIDAVCDNMCHFSKILSDLQKQQELIHQQLEEKETEVKASDIVDIRRRQAALEQRVLNFHRFTSKTSLILTPNFKLFANNNSHALTSSTRR